VSTLQIEMSENPTISVDVLEQTAVTSEFKTEETISDRKLEPFHRYPPKWYLDKAKEKFTSKENGILFYETGSKYENGLNTKYQLSPSKQTSGNKLSCLGCSSALLLGNSPFLWEFIPDLTSSGVLSYTRKVKGLFAILCILLVTTSIAFPDSPVLVPAIILCILNALIQVSIEYFTVAINRVLVARVKCILDYRLRLNIGPPSSTEYSTDLEERQWLHYLSSVFLDMEDCSQTLDSFVIDPPVTIRPVMWCDYPFALAFGCVPSNKSQLFLLIRGWSYLVHFVLYFSPALWIFSSDRSYQVQCCSIHAAITFIVLVIILYRDFKRTAIHLDYAVNEYFLQLIHFRFRFRHVNADYRESIKKYFEDRGKFHAIHFQRFIYAVLLNEFSHGSKVERKDQVECVDLLCCQKKSKTIPSEYKEMPQ